jgi:glucuronoarabinoxylan endo-1,4-beta-xylanase
MHDSLAEGDASAWLYWNLVWSDMGLVALDGATFHVRDQYYAVRHYAKFTEPGDTRVSASSSQADLRVSAWLAPDQRRLTLVVLNVGTSDRTASLAACGYAFTQSDVVRTVFRDDGSGERWKDLGPLGLDASVLLPARAVATVILQR